LRKIASAPPDGQAAPAAAAQIHIPYWIEDGIFVLFDSALFHLRGGAVPLEKGEHGRWRRGAE
jgi:hypothetical protein